MRTSLASLRRLLLPILLLAGFLPATLSAQNPCTTDSLVISTGWDYTTNAVGATGTYSSAWQVIADPSPATTEPRPSALVTADAAWDGPLAGSQWISAYPSSDNDTNGLYTLEYCFCLTRRVGNVRLSFDILADDRATIYLNGTQIGMTVPSFAFLIDSLTTVNMNITGLVRPGKNCITVELENTNSVAMGLDIRGSITASGIALQDPSCCNDSTAGLTGTKFEDLDCDGIYDPGEPPLSGIQILLSNGSTTTTDGLGNYYFNNLPSGTYTLSENPFFPWTQTYPASGSYTVTLANGQVLGGFDFGNCDSTRTDHCFETRNDTTICTNDGILQVAAQFDIRSLMPCGTPQSATFVSLDPNITLFPASASVTTSWSQVNINLSGPGVVQGAVVPIEVTVCCYSAPGIPPVCCTDTLMLVIDCGTPLPCMTLLSDTISCELDPAGNNVFNYQVSLDAQLPCPDPVFQGTFTVITPTTGITVSPSNQPVIAGVGTYGMTISGPGAVPGTAVGIEVEICCHDPATGADLCCRDTLWVKLPECPKSECKDCCRDFPKQVLPLHWSFGNGTTFVGGWMSAGNTKICTVSATLVDATINGQPVVGAFVAPATLGGTPGTIPFRHEVIWTGVDVNAGPTPFGMRLQFPPVALPPGRDRIRFCIRFRFTDENCVTCDTVICFTQRRRRWFFFDPNRDNETTIAPGITSNPTEMINGWSLHPEQVVTGPGATEGRIDEIRIVPQGMNREGTEEHVGIELRASTSGLSIDAEDVVIGWDDAVAAGTLPKRDDATRPVPPTDAARLLAITALFPDPTSGDITILLDDDRKRDGLAVIVTDMSGREVLRVTDAMPSGAEDGRIVVATDDLDAGTYHCTVRSGGESATRSFRVVR